MMRQNKVRINNTLSQIQIRIKEEPYVDPNTSQHIKDRYVTYLIQKNLRKALLNEEINFLNYFSNLDAIEQYGVVDPEQKMIGDKKEF